MRLVFTLVVGIFIACVISTLTSFAEIPLDVLAASQAFGKGRRRSSHYTRFVSDEAEGGGLGEEMEKLDVKPSYGSFEDQQQHVPGNPFAKPAKVTGVVAAHQLVSN